MDDILLGVHCSGPAGIRFDFAPQKIPFEFTPQEQDRIKGEGSKQAQPRCVKNGGQIHVNFLASSFLFVFYHLLDNLLKSQKLMPGKRFNFYPSYNSGINLFFYLNFGTLSPEVIKDESGSGLPDGVKSSGHPKVDVVECGPILDALRILGDELRQRTRHVILVGVRVFRDVTCNIGSCHV